MTMYPDNRREQYLEKPLPSSDEAEKVILGSILLDNRLIEAAAEVLIAGDFYSPLNRRIFTGMLVLFAAHREINPMLIGEELKKEGSLEAMGGTSTITNLCFGLPHFSNIDEYLKVVKEKSMRRQLIRACNAITSEALAEEENNADLFGTVQTTINDLCLRAENGTSDERFVSLEHVLSTDVAKALSNLRDGVSNKIRTGFAKIDRSIGGGLSVSDILLLVADTGAGKSALALQTAYQIAEQGIPVAFLAGEMSDGENVLRLLSQVSGTLNLNSAEHLSQQDYELLGQWADSIKHVPMYFDSRTSDLQTLRPILKSIVRRHGVKVLVIDYIQLFKVDKLEKRKRTERIAEASQEVKRIAAELGIAIIEVAQFNREGGKSVRPTLHDLEGSGQLEKDASLIFILETNEGTMRDVSNREYHDAWIRIEKGRNTGKGKIEGRFYGSSVRFDFG